MKVGLKKKKKSFSFLFPYFIHFIRFTFVISLKKKNKIK